MSGSSQSNNPRKFTILGSDFLYSADSVSSLPPEDDRKEVAIIGRSNVGKSSLLNTLLQRKKLARTGKTPGATKVLCFYEVRFRYSDGNKSDDYSGRIVDLPGYGFAKVSDSMRSSWKKTLTYYLSSRKSLQAVVLLVDARRELEDEEREIISMGRDGGLLLCLTKSDKVSRNDIAKRIFRISSDTGIPQHAITSVTTMGKDSFGRLQSLRETVLSFLI